VRNINAYTGIRHKQRKDSITPGETFPSRSVRYSFLTTVHILRIWYKLGPHECPIAIISRAKFIMFGNLVMSSIKYSKLVMSFCRIVESHEKELLLMVSNIQENTSSENLIKHKNWFFYARKSKFMCPINQPIY
jgi:hypothetical protein